MLLLFCGILLPTGLLFADPPDSPLEAVWIIDGEHTSELITDPLSQVSAADSSQYIDNSLPVLQQHMSKEGYFGVAVDSLVFEHSENPGRAYLHVSKGDQYRVGTVSHNLTGSNNPPSPPEDFPIDGSLWENELIEEYIGMLLSFYEDEGYPLAEIEIDEIITQDADQTVDLALTIDPGMRAYAEGVSFSGLERLESEWLQRIAALPDSTLITPETMSRVRRNLEQVDLFEFVSQPEIRIERGSPQIHFEVEEMPATSFDILLGYMPERGGPEGTGNMIVGQADLDVRNIFSQGSTLSMAFERMEPMVTRLDLGYRQEWIMGLPVSAGGSFDFFQQDSTYQVRNLRLKSGYQLNSSTEIEATFRQQNTSANTNPDLPVRALDGSTTFVGAGIHYRNLDSRVNPTSGMELYLHGETGQRTISDSRAEDLIFDEQQSIQRVNLRLQPYFSPFNRHVLTGRVNVGYLDGSDFTESDMMRFGGARSLRGYREEQFLASRYSWADTEYRYLLGPRSYAFIFGGAGTYGRDPYIVEQDFEEAAGTGGEWLYSWGMGFSYATPLGFVEFSYAVARNESPANGLVHFGMRSRF